MTTTQNNSEKVPYFTLPPADGKLWASQKQRLQAKISKFEQLEQVILANLAERKEKSPKKI